MQSRSCDADEICQALLPYKTCLSLSSLEQCLVVDALWEAPSQHPASDHKLGVERCWCLFSKQRSDFEQSPSRQSRNKDDGELSAYRAPSFVEPFFMFCYCKLWKALALHRARSCTPQRAIEFYSIQSQQHFWPVMKVSILKNTPSSYVFRSCSDCGSNFASAEPATDPTMQELHILDVPGTLLSFTNCLQSLL